MYAKTHSGRCVYVTSAMDFGQDVVRLPAALVEEEDVQTFYVRFTCRLYPALGGLSAASAGSDGADKCGYHV